MSETCNNDCGSCSADCADRDMRLAANDKSNVKKVIGVVSGKGGVGKSMVTSLLAVAASRGGSRTAILDADITGPSIAQIFNIHGMASVTPDGLLLPSASEAGVKVMSINLLLENETDPVVWRGAMISGVLGQFWTEVAWGDVDVMFIDMPPGTGDVPLTVFQSLPVDGLVVVTSPQEMVGMIVEKAVRMAGLMEVPVIGIVENMSYYVCPNCGEKHRIFGESHVQQIAASFAIGTVEELPLESSWAALCDRGQIEQIRDIPLQKLSEVIRNL